MPSPHLSRHSAPALLRIGAATLFGLACVLPGSSALAQQELAALPAISQNYCIEEEELDFLALINDYRTQNGLSPLQISQTLGAAAATHSDHMAATSYFDHTMSDGTSVVQNIRNHGYTGETYGENIAAGTESADYAFSTFQGSAAHNQNMLQASYQSIGIARAYDAASGYGWYWTTIFGGPLDFPADICGQPSNQLLASASTAEAADDLNLRSGPGTGYAILTEVPEGSDLSVTGAAEAGYVPVAFQGFTGWVAETFLLREMTSTQPAATSGGAETIDEVNLRTGPGLEFAILTEIPRGSLLTVNGVTEAGFLPVTFSGFTGWVANEFVAREVTAAQPAASTATATQALNLRAGPAVTDPILLVIPAGGEVALTGVSDAGYLGVNYGGTQGWADGAYLAIADAGLANPSGQLAGFSTGQPAATETGEVMATANLNLRASAGPDGAILTVVPRGGVMVLTGDPQTNGYVGVSYNGTIGWVDANYLG
jgi:uncharacterized protein YkwD/uncharacterized protein YraI